MHMIYFHRYLVYILCWPFSSFLSFCIIQMYVNDVDIYSYYHSMTVTAYLTSKTSV